MSVSEGNWVDNKELCYSHYVYRIYDIKTGECNRDIREWAADNGFHYKNIERSDCRACRHKDRVPRSFTGNDGINHWVCVHPDLTREEIKRHVRTIENDPSWSGYDPSKTGCPNFAEKEICVWVDDSNGDFREVGREEVGTDYEPILVNPPENQPGETPTEPEDNPPASNPGTVEQLPVNGNENEEMQDSDKDDFAIIFPWQEKEDSDKTDFQNIFPTEDSMDRCGDKENTLECLIDSGISTISGNISGNKRPYGATSGTTTKQRYTCEERCAYGRKMAEKCKGCRGYRPKRYCKPTYRRRYYSAKTYTKCGTKRRRTSYRGYYGTRKTTSKTATKKTACSCK